ncbi:MAG: DEDD exonuclease domain-containing protein [Actinobacteria bacterium]|nr:DEDD exonuclease domain-containing protein [Actinomycetota bacterium]
MSSTATTFVQASFDELGEPLREMTFCVVDLETTGVAPDSAEITEIGAVKVRGGAVQAEFHSLLDPGGPIPAFITVLTGITDAMVVSAPRLPAVLPAFLEFARGSVLVAHNAPFDVGFLKVACARHGYPWPGLRVLDTAMLARRVLVRDEAPNCKLATLARLFGAGTTPDHRALSDARATVDVLHGLLERVGALGVQSYQELVTYSGLVRPERRRKRHLAEPLPHAPGVYLFRDAEGRPLYVGKSNDLRNRVRSYFTAGETRSRMAEMVGLAERVDAVVCAHGLEAEVRELRLIAEHKPRYNRRSKFPERAVWVTVTVEPFPRLSIIRTPRGPAAEGGSYLGPFGSRRLAEQAVAAVYEALPLRQCGGRLPLTPRRSACALVELGRCGGPCVGAESRTAYGEHVATFSSAVAGDLRPLVEPVLHRIEVLSGQRRYEDAATLRDRLAVLVRAADRVQRLTTLAGIASLVAARPAGAGGWELALVRHGRLAGASTVPQGAAPRPYVDALLATGQTVLPATGQTVLPADPPAFGTVPYLAGGVEESECVQRWLDGPGVRLVELDGQWATPPHGGGRWRRWLELATAGQRGQVDPFADRRRLVPGQTRTGT